MVCSRYPKEYRYYEIILKRKCFRKLKENVWERKTKWILLKKADCHYREKLLRKSIRSWLTYLSETYRKKINRRAAEVFYHEKLKSRGIFALKKNLEVTWMMMRISRNKFEWDLKFKCWHQWKHYAEKRVKIREVKQLANRIRKERLRIRFLYLWLFRFNEKRSLQIAYETAAAKHNEKLIERYFKAWKIFANKKICKAKIKTLAITCYEDKLKEKFFRCWKRYAYQKKRYKYQMNIIRNFYENYLLKSYFSQWQIIYKEVKRNRKIINYNLAVDFHERKLLDKSFRAFCKLHERKKNEREKMDEFRNVYVKVYLNLWMEKAREKINWNNLENKATNWREVHLQSFYLTKIFDRYQTKVEEREEMANVIKYSNSIVMHKAFRKWCDTTERKLRTKIELENASKFYTEKLTRKCFSKWKKYLVRKSRKKTADGYNRFILLSRAIEEWKNFLAERKIKSAEAKNLEEKHSKKLMKKVFDFWKTETIVSTSKIIAAVEFRNKSKLSKTFYVWKTNTRRKLAIKNRINRNRAILDGTIIKNSIHHWHEMLSIKKALEKKVEEFRLKQGKKSLRTHYKTWQKFTEKMKILRQNVDVYPQLRSNILTETYLNLLLTAVKTKRDFKKKEKLAEQARENLLKRTYLRRWLSFVCWKKERLLRCLEEREDGSKENIEVVAPPKGSSRRQPMIPGYLKGEFFGQSEGMEHHYRNELKEWNQLI